jgi:hypothetical protein
MLPASGYGGGDCGVGGEGGSFYDLKITQDISEVMYCCGLNTFSSIDLFESMSGPAGEKEVSYRASDPPLE